MPRQSGVTMIELLTVMAILGLGLGIASLWLQPIESPLQSGAALTESLFRQARLEAIATTAAYRVWPDGLSSLASEYAPSCSTPDDEWTPDGTVGVQLPNGVEVSDTTWKVCFTSRGISDTNQTIQLVHDTYGTIQIEVLLGGTTRIIQ